jgi:hypothetical protein
MAARITADKTRARGCESDKINVALQHKDALPPTEAHIVITGISLTQLRNGLDRGAASLFNTASTTWSALRGRHSRAGVQTNLAGSHAEGKVDRPTNGFAFPLQDMAIAGDASPTAAPAPIPDAVPDAHASEAAGTDVAPVRFEAAIAEPVAEPSAVPGAAPVLAQDPAIAPAPASAAGATEAAAAPLAEEAPPAPALRSVPAPRSDPELEGLHQRIARMQEKVLDLESRKADMDALVEEHAFRQYQALGDLLRDQLALRGEVLNLRAERSQSESDRAAAAAAAEELAAYERAARGTPPVEINVAPEVQDELRAIYRSAVMRCHPDRVSDADKAHAHEVFLRTQEAYRRRDLEALRLIDRQIDSDLKLARADDGRNAFDQMQAFLAALEDKGVELAMSIHALQGEARYRQARQRERWDDDFASLRAQIESECAALRREIARY